MIRAMMMKFQAKSHVMNNLIFKVLTFIDSFFIYSKKQVLAMGKNKRKPKTNNSQKQSASSGSKKTKNIFKVATSGSNKKSQKKTKEIPNKLKQLDLKTKDKANNQLKDLHLKMVSKKEKAAPKAVGKKSKGPAPSTKEVQDTLNKMDVK